MKTYLQSIVDDFSFDKFPVKWQDFDFGRFSSDKTLFDFQKQGLQNALKALWLFYKEKNGDKKQYYDQYQANGFETNFDYDLTRERKSAGHLLEFDKDFPVTNEKISFAYFINRMSFWMATGSGKTLIIVKLISFLDS